MEIVTAATAVTGRAPATVTAATALAATAPAATGAATGRMVIAGPGTVPGGTTSRWLPNQAMSVAPSCPAG